MAAEQRIVSSSPANGASSPAAAAFTDAPRTKVPAVRMYPDRRSRWLKRSGIRLLRAGRTASEAPGIRWFTAIVSPGAHTDWVKRWAVPPVPSFKIPDEKKVDVLIAVQTSLRDSIDKWEDRLYQGSLASAGAMLLTVGFFLQHPGLARYQHAVVWAMFLFGGFATLYLLLAARARTENGAFLVQIEAAMGLCDFEGYLLRRRLVGYSGRWMRNWRAFPLLLGHTVIWLFSVYVLREFPTVKLPL